MTAPTTMMIDNVKYVREDSVENYNPPNGKRVVLVIDRGWIVAGDCVTDPVTGMKTLNRAVGIRNWSSIGFNGVLDNPLSDKVKLEKFSQIFEVPVNSVLFAVKVVDNWGLK